MPEPVVKKPPTPPPIPKTIPHPIFGIIMQLEKDIDHLESIQTPQDATDYICDDVMGLHNNKYRKKIKGFHLAFNTKEKVQESSNYKYKPEGTAEEIRIKALTLKTQRLYKKEMTEQAKRDKDANDREVLRKMHEKLRRKK